VDRVWKEWGRASRVQKGECGRTRQSGGEGCRYERDGVMGKKSLCLMRWTRGRGSSSPQLIPARRSMYEDGFFLTMVHVCAVWPRLVLKCEVSWLLQRSMGKSKDLS
jgi:hypothetical protein